MPDFVVNIKIDPSGAVDGSRRAKDAISGVGGAVLGLNQALELAQKGFALLRTAIELPIRQFQALFGVSSDLVRKYDEQVLAQTKLLAVLKASGQGAEGQADALERLAAQLQAVTRFDDDAIVAGQALAIGLGVPLGQMERFTKAAVDLAAFLEQDVVQGFRSLNLAVQTGSIPRLAQNITDAKDPLQRFDDVLKFVEGHIKGIAQEAAKVGAGPLIQLEQVFSDFEQALGRVVSETPQFQEFVQNTKEALQELITFIDSNRDRLGAAFGNLFVASFNLAKAALLTFVDVAKAAFSTLLDLFLQVADSRIGKLLNLDEGIGDLKRYRAAVDEVRRDEQSLAAVEQQLAEQRKQRQVIADRFAANPPRDATDEMLRGGNLALVDRKIEETASFAAKLQEQLGGSRDRLSELRNEALGINPQGVFSPLIAAAAQFEGIVKEGRAELQGVIDIASRPLRGESSSFPFVSAEESDRAREEARVRQLGFGSQDATRPGPPKTEPQLVEHIEQVNDKLTESLNLYGQFKQTVLSTEDVIIGSIHSMASELTDAIVEFTETGKLNFKELARSIISDIERIIIQALILKAVEAGLGELYGGKTTTGSGTSGARAGGGPVLPGNSYLVGEEGPEIVSFGRPGQVHAASESAAALQPQVNVRVVDVRSPDELGAALASGKYDNEVVAILQRRRRSIGQISP